MKNAFWFVTRVAQQCEASSGRRRVTTNEHTQWTGVSRPGTTGFAASTHATSGTSRALRERPAALYSTLEEPRRLDRPRLAHNINGTDGRGFLKLLPLQPYDVTSGTEGHNPGHTSHQKDPLPEPSHSVPPHHRSSKEARINLASVSLAPPHAGRGAGMIVPVPTPRHYSCGAQGFLNLYCKHPRGVVSSAFFSPSQVVKPSKTGVVAAVVAAATAEVSAAGLGYFARRDECVYSLKMYTGSGISKETQHISPHIAAHKSSLAPTSSVSSITSVAVNSGGLYDLAHHPANKSAFNTHIPTYKVGMHQPHHSIVKGLDHDGASLLGRHGHIGLPTHHSKSAPQDLSAHASGTEKALPLELTPHSSAHHKPLPHIQSVVSQGGSHIGGLVPAHQTDRGAPYFRMPDSVINVQGPSAVLVSSGGEGVSSTPHSMAHTTTMVHAGSAHSGATNLTTMSAASMACTMPGGVASTMSQSHLMPNDCSAVSSVSTGGVIPHPDLRGVKKEKSEQLEGMGMAAGQRDECHPEAGPQRDLVRQALQAVVTHPQHKTGNDQEVIEYNYTAGDIAELLMMNIQVNASLQAMNKGTGNDNIPHENESEEVVMLQPAEVSETNSTSLMSQNPKRRRPKLSEEAQAERRVRIALRMREKRATESDDQKRVRRIREAERMRRKRATEDEDQKVRRRLEAANRARNRRATMTSQEREADRRRAAERMRLRRANESPESKSVRRVKAAERMRKRRASETPEQRAQRRQNIAVRMKARRKRKSEGSINDGDELTDMEHSVDNRLVKDETTRSVTQQENSGTVNANQSTPQAQAVTSSPHIFVPSTIGVGGGSIAVLHVDSPLPPMSVGHAGAPGLSTVDMAQLGQPLSLQKSSSANQDQPLPAPRWGAGHFTRCPTVHQRMDRNLPWWPWKPTDT
ncbi:hypothetical protein O3P69_004265 [Scylla paramamosain]|uniref:Uncharacterized protein n=2 Tax=Scylla paramamosain TaxID=85552 RepID=A0AAW0ULI2_SCYPA